MLDLLCATSSSTVVTSWWIVEFIVVFELSQLTLACVDELSGTRKAHGLTTCALLSHAPDHDIIPRFALSVNSIALSTARDIDAIITECVMCLAFVLADFAWFHIRVVFGLL